MIQHSNVLLGVAGAGAAVAAAAAALLLPPVALAVLAVAATMGCLALALRARERLRLAERVAAAREQELQEARTIAARERRQSAGVLGRIGTPVVTFDEAWRVTGVNECFLAMTGYRAEQVVGAPAPPPFWPEIDLARIEEACERVETAGIGAFEWTLRRENGQLFPAGVILAVVPGGGLVATVHDLTAPRTSERTLRRERDHAAAMADLVSGDLAQTRRETERLLDAVAEVADDRQNAERFAELAAARAELAADLALAPSGADRVRAALEGMIAHAGLAAGAVYLSPGSDAGPPRLAASSGITADALPGTVIPGEGTAGRTLEDGRPAVIEVTASRLLGPSAGAETGPGFEVHLPLRPSDETLGHLILGAPTPLPDWLVAELAELADEVARCLVGADVLTEAPGRQEGLLALVSRELRTPLTSVMGFLEVLLENDEVALDEQMRSYVETAGRNADRLERLVDDLITIAEVERGAPGVRERIDVAELVSERCGAAAGEARRCGVELSLVVDGAGPIEGDAAAVARAIDNLLTNGIRFTPAGGRVDVVVGATGARVVVEVSDTGLGISPEDLPSLFEPDAAGPASTCAFLGAGLGLAVVKAVAASHDGAIDVESVEGHGATFRLTLPAAAVPAVGAGA